MKFKKLKQSIIKQSLWASEDRVLDINYLLYQLSEKAKKHSKENLQRIVSQPGMICLGAFDKRMIVGVASIHFRQTLIRKIGIIEDVVVDKNYRGKGIGRKLTKMLIKEAKKQKADCVELTSKPSRIEANTLYESLGFKKRETNYYRLNF